MKLLPLLSVTILLVGCAKPNGQSPPSGEQKPAAASSPAAAEPNTPIEVSILSYDQIQERIASKKGKVVVVDAWSTACPPCMKDFHNLVELHKQYGPDHVACVSLSFDFEGGKDAKPEDVQPAVLKFLRSQGATFDNLLSNEESDVLYRKFKLNAVPAVFVYGADGELRKRFENEGAYEEVRKLVAELVKDEPTASESAPGNPAPSEPAKP